MHNGCPDSFFSIDHSATVLSDLIVSSMAAFEACAVNRNRCFSVPNAAAAIRNSMQCRQQV